MKKLFLIIIAILAATAVLSQTFEDKVENQLLSLTARVNALEQKMDSPERFAPSKSIFMNAVLLGLIGLLFVMNVTTLVKMKSLSSTPPQKVKSNVKNKIKKYMDYCRFHKGLDMNSCKQQLKQRGWTEEQINEAMKK